MLQKNVDKSNARPFQERDERQMTVLINAAVIQGERDGLCRIRNVSATGLSIETSMPLSVDEPAVVTLHSGFALTCIVRWTRDGRTGMSCEANPLEAVRGAQGVTPEEDPGPALPRFSRAVAAEAAVLGIIHPCRMDSISTRDIILTGVTEGFEPGRFFSVHIRGLGDFPATVRVSEGESIFARFAAPIPFATLDGWLTDEPWKRERSISHR